MSRRALVSLAGILGIVLILGVVSYAPAEGPAQKSPQPDSAGAARAAVTATPSTSAVIDSFVAERDSLMKVVLAKIAGHEEEPSEKVFKNIKVMKDVPAGRLLRIMNVGFGRSLGVSCGHCHVVGEWEKEDKNRKQITREMMAMNRTINDEILPKIANLESKKPVVNCTTCHRGQRKPATNL